VRAEKKTIDKLSLVGKKRGGNEWNGLICFSFFEEQ